MKTNRELHGSPRRPDRGLRVATGGGHGAELLVAHAGVVAGDGLPSRTSSLRGCLGTAEEGEGTK